MGGAAVVPGLEGDEGGDAVPLPTEVVIGPCSIYLKQDMVTYRCVLI